MNLCPSFGYVGLWTIHLEL